MKTPTYLRRLLTGTLILLVGSFSLAAAEGPLSTTETNLVSEELINPQLLLRSYLQLQEQLHSTLKAIEENRKSTEEATQKSAEAMAARLNVIEQGLMAQREKEIDAIRSSSRLTLALAAVLGAVGLGSMLLSVWFQSRTVNRLAQLAAGLPASHQLGQPAFVTLAGGDTLGSGGVERATGNFLGTIERLEKRLQELEHTTGPVGGVQPGTDSPVTAAEAESSHAPAAAAQPANFVVLSSKGNSLLKLGRNEEALKCFEAALKLEPEDADTLLKRGVALERLNQVEEALQSFDKAIALNKDLTTAYLLKGGVYSRLDRHQDALECYESALKNQPQPA